MVENEYLTVVVPAYNVERFLAQCIESLVHQTVIKHKVIIVNDGATDSTGSIAKKYAEKYPTLIRYVEQNNKGLSAARNAGLALVDTPYVAFLDSDDWLMPNFVEVLDRRIHQYVEAPDLVYTLPVVYDMASNRFEKWMDKEIFLQVFNERECVINPQVKTIIYALEPNGCRKVYNVAFLKKMQFCFVEGTKWEDVEPHFQLLHEARHIIGEEKTGFFYRINSGNQITASGGWDRLQMISVFRRTLHRALNEEWESITVSYILSMLLTFMKWSVDVSMKDVRIEFVEQMHSLFLEIPQCALRNYYRDLKVWKRDRVYFWLVRSPFYRIVANPLKYSQFKARFYQLRRIVRREV